MAFPLVVARPLPDASGARPAGCRGAGPGSRAATGFITTEFPTETVKDSSPWRSSSASPSRSS